MKRSVDCFVILGHFFGFVLSFPRSEVPRAPRRARWLHAVISNLFGRVQRSRTPVPTRSASMTLGPRVTTAKNVRGLAEISKANNKSPWSPWKRQSLWPIVLVSFEARKHQTCLFHNSSPVKPNQQRLTSYKRKSILIQEVQLSQPLCKQ